MGVWSKAVENIHETCILLMNRYRLGYDEREKGGNPTPLTSAATLAQRQVIRMSFDYCIKSLRATHLENVIFEQICSSCSP